MAEESPWGPGVGENPIVRSRHFRILPSGKSDIAMENGPFISDVPNKTCICTGCSIAMFDYQRVRCAGVRVCPSIDDVLVCSSNKGDLPSTNLELREGNGSMIV